MNEQDKPNLAATSWALLGVLSYEQELTGYDIRKWISWSMRFFYGSPAYSQIYTELKKLEKLGLVESRVENSGETRSRRVYRITEAGFDAVRRWADEEPVELPSIKHPAVLRVTLGHLTNPTRLRQILQDYVSEVDKVHQQAARDARWAALELSWAYGRVALQWAERYYASERELALKMIKDLDEAQADFEQAGKVDGQKVAWPSTDYWYEVERRADAEDTN